MLPETANFRETNFCFQAFSAVIICYDNSTGAGLVLFLVVSLTDAMHAAVIFQHI